MKKLAILLSTIVFTIYGFGQNSKPVNKTQSKPTLQNSQSVNIQKSTLMLKTNIKAKIQINTVDVGSLDENILKSFSVTPGKNMLSVMSIEDPTLKLDTILNIPNGEQEILSVILEKKINPYEILDKSFAAMGINKIGNEIKIMTIINEDKYDYKEQDYTPTKTRNLYLLNFTDQATTAEKYFEWSSDKNFMEYCRYINGVKYYLPNRIVGWQCDDKESKAINKPLGILSQTYFSGPLLIYKIKNCLVEFLGKQKTYNGNILKIAIKSKEDGDLIEYQYFFDEETFLPTQVNNKQFLDYKLVNGLMLPTKTISKKELKDGSIGTIISTIKINEQAFNKIYSKEDYEYFFSVPKDVKYNKF